MPRRFSTAFSGSSSNDQVTKGPVTRACIVVPMFEAWGRFVYRRRWYVLVVSAVLLGLSVAGILTGGTLAGNGGFGADLAAGKAAKLVAAEIQPEQAPTGSGMELVFISKT